MRCGCEPERALYARHNVSFGVEGPNGMSSDVRGLGEHGRLHTARCPHQLVAHANANVLLLQVGILAWLQFAHTDCSCIAVDYYYHVEGYSGPPSWEIFWVFGKIVGGGCNSDASSSCCRDFGCSVDGD